MGVGDIHRQGNFEMGWDKLLSLNLKVYVKRNFEYIIILHWFGKKIYFYQKSFSTNKSL